MALISRADGVSLAHVAVGDGPVMIVVHGGPGLDHQYLRPGVDRLGRSRTVVYYDQRGVGQSVSPVTDEAISVTEYVADLDALADHYGAARFTLMAHSWGALLALNYALQRPDRLDGLVLVGPVEPGARFTDLANDRAASRQDSAVTRELGQLMETEALRERDPVAMERLYRLLYAATVPEPEVLDRVNFLLHPNTAMHAGDVAQLLMDSMESTDLWDQLGGLEVPTLVVYGDFDPSPPEMVEALVAALPRARLARLVGVGHFPFVEATGSFTEAVEAFGAEVRGQGR